MQISILLFTGSIGLFFPYLCNRSTFFFWVWAPQGLAIQVCSLWQWKAEKRLSCDAIYLVDTHVRHIHDITDFIKLAVLKSMFLWFLNISFFNKWSHKHLKINKKCGKYTNYLSNFYWKTKTKGERKKEKLSKKLLVLAYDLFSPVLLIEPIIFLHFRSHLMNSQCQKNNNPLF